MEGLVSWKVSLLDRAPQREGDGGIASIRSAMPMVEMDILSAVINAWPTLINAQPISRDQPFSLSLL